MYANINTLLTALHNNVMGVLTALYFSPTSVTIGNFSNNVPYHWPVWYDIITGTKRILHAQSQF